MYDEAMHGIAKGLYPRMPLFYWMEDHHILEVHQIAKLLNHNVYSLSNYKNGLLQAIKFCGFLHRSMYVQPAQLHCTVHVLDIPESRESWYVVTSRRV
ncbi:hypothetical protein AR543_01865 [Paenibacillus bovis]|uniref:Uncharacterized protein n=1 Tax=Paenibacillus bovis TaxID=1616788 RepID=A0A172ZBJ7_9BACL|nr:hypothetical protein AR543_01865 [Paenibacillus bovis]